jgi:hypothetical protein
MNLKNPLGRDQFTGELQAALVEACGFSKEIAKLFPGHCLRVGGSNYMRRLGLSDDIHRKLGGWSSIESSQGYMVLSAREQATMCERIALTHRRSCAFAQSDMAEVMEDMSALIL